jgi:pimeloyl-ACP methyl ester carboxylesterase
MPKVKVNDIEMYYEVHGEGEPLVLLHGYFCSSQQWNHFIPEFQERFQLVIPDLRGHGRTTNPSEFTHRQAALDVFKLLDHLNIEHIKSIGFSAGGSVLLHMATLQPERIQSMILDGTTPRDTKEAQEHRAQTTMENIAWCRQNHIYGEAQVRKLYEQFKKLGDYSSDEITKPYLSTIQAKTLIIHGDRDDFFPVEVALYMYEAIPDSYLWVIPNAGHALVLGDHADDIKRVALDFFIEDWGTQ